jgi:hypothetical protein
VVGATTLAAGFGGTKLTLPDMVRDRLLDRFPDQAEALAKQLGFSADCFTNREARFLAGLKSEHEMQCLIPGRPGINAASRAPALFGTHKRNRPTLTAMLISTISSPDKLKLPEIRLLTPEENQQLTDLAEDVARQILGPDWKEQQEQRRTALNEKIAKQ